MITQFSQERNLPRPAVLGIASGIFFLAFFGGFWGFTSASFMNGASQVIAFCIVGIVTLVYFGIGGMIVRYARTLPQEVSPEDAAVGKRIGIWFGIVFGTEILLIVLASILLSNFQADHFITAVVALIVGLHFLPLARLFRVPVYYVTGVLLTVLALVAIAALLFGLQIGGPSPYNWSMFVGVGATLILWLTVLSIARLGWRVMRQEG